MSTFFIKMDKKLLKKMEIVKSTGKTPSTKEAHVIKSKAAQQLLK